MLKQLPLLRFVQGVRAPPENADILFFFQRPTVTILGWAEGGASASYKEIIGFSNTKLNAPATYTAKDSSQIS
ncbi:hypothetical protein EVAR_17842_1 [Eumeta japonica]|uniref:Uncharacterized protein n=1 Tax=Eumeta variegata TaxID=151549 RepID=A0A4C1TTM7_EUMVA|nr:hypothetical protein EVAR_17842_1 [Eumeta japonica]